MIDIQKQSNECRSFLSDEFMTDAICYLRNVKQQNPYIDLDSIHSKKGYEYKCSNLYNSLSEYLNKMRDKMEVPCKFRFSENGSYPGIEVVDKDFCLKSDQLAFSFNDKAAYDSKYPCGKYFQSLEEKDDDGFSFLAEYVYCTRGIGCSFLWPILNDKLNPDYNKKRGIRNYIEDSVDLTLWEIKECYEWLNYPELEKEENNPTMEDNLLIKCCKKDTEEAEKTKEWLKSIGSFKKYVEFFCFGAFVKGNNPIDIVNSDLSKGEVKLLTDEIVKGIRESRKKRIRDTIAKKEDVERLLKNVMKLVCSRSMTMEEVLKNP